MARDTDWRAGSSKTSQLSESAAPFTWNKSFQSRSDLSTISSLLTTPLAGLCMPVGSQGQVRNPEALKDPLPGAGSAQLVFGGACLPSKVRPIV